MRAHRYIIEQDPSGDCALQLRCSETGVVVAKGINGTTFLNDTPTPFKAWKQAREIRDKFEAWIKEKSA